ncbi:hypothetical protein ECG_09411 [Echinococcus granulosus]|uniref:Venom allergen val protein n=1 Tax=Echinococcus granulosus TaxID=6210 RepID=A0A068WLX7_ECHGR|nr:hypothetical protein ECG_09411 [Echinococcus granulosus]CDS20759.1 venom allergen val protein [Echinococcus granulosus]
MPRLMCFLALLCSVYTDNRVETMKAGLIEAHKSFRDNFKFRGKKLTPLKYSTELENLARVWVDTCSTSRPKDRRFANLGSNVISSPIYASLVRRWRIRMSTERGAYNPATGKCTASTCQHYRQVVQPNDINFGCAVKFCLVRKPAPIPSHLSVCLYRAVDQCTPIQQREGLTACITRNTTTRGQTTTTTITTTTATKAPTTPTVTSSTGSDPAPSVSTILSEETQKPQYFTVFPVDNDSEVKRGSDKEEVGEGEEDEVQEEDEKEEKEDEKKEKAAKVSESTKLSPHLLYFGIIANTLYS